MPDEAPLADAPTADDPHRPKSRARAQLWWLFGWVAVFTVLFCRPLISLFAYASKSDLHSHIVLVPFVVAYLIHLRRPQFPKIYPSFSWPATFAFISAGSSLALVLWLSSTLAIRLSGNDYLALMALAYVCFLWAGGFFFLGVQGMGAIAFPVAFLIFLVPLPDGITDLMEKISMLGSAEAADLLFSLTGTPVLRNGVVFELPGMVIRVAQECSGIRSSWVLFITSLVASHLFLNSPWRRIVLVAVVIPLAILRNGFRILVIGLLCVHVGPHMIDSVIHHRGGPIFFALSLIPLYLLLCWLRRGDVAAAPPPVSHELPNKI